MAIGKSNKKWTILNQHGKACLKGFLFALSSSDIITSQLDYLVSKYLVDSVLNLKDQDDRQKCAGYCLTDLGMETARHYFPDFTHWDKTAYFSSNNLSNQTLNLSNKGKKKYMVECSVCGKLTVPRIPKDGDGSVYLPRRHKVNGEPCLGNIEEARLIDIDITSTF